MRPVVIGIYGKSDAGKTSLLVQLIRKLTDEGCTVATIKKTDKKIGIDTKGKDTWKHSQAGATVVVLSSPVETDYLVKQKQEINDIIGQLALLGSYDVVLIEGARDPTIPKIRVGDIAERENTIGTYEENFDEIVTMVRKKINEHTRSELEQNVSVKVNGNVVPLTAFPSTFIKNIVVGMLRSLKGVNDINEVELRFKC